MTIANRTLELDVLQGWIGREEAVTDFLDLAALRRVRTYFGMSPNVAEGDAIDETWHWCFFNPAVPAAQLARDGHPMTGDFLPPFDLPRRMWGGSRLSFHEPLRAGKEAKRVSRILSVDLKRGKSGTLGLVKVEHVISQDGAVCRREEQDIVYREPASGPQAAISAPECPTGSQASQEVKPDPVTLFRYSALTYNAHRIHYDRDYATGEEGYPALVVHGPLTASLLVGFSRANRDRAPMTAFSFRGTSPLFDTAPFTLHSSAEGNKDTLWVERPGGGMAMIAEALY